MRILIDIGHPAHVHLFKHFAWVMQEKGHRILFTAREKEHEIYLLKHYHFAIKSFGKHYKTKTGKLFGVFKFTLQMFFAAFKFKPDIYLSHGSVYAAPVAWLMRKPHIALEDSGNMEQIRLYKPFSSVIICPDILPENLGKKQIRVKSYHELAYLHPSYFIPNVDVLKELGVLEGERFCILRFVSWNATHDNGQIGLTENEKNMLVGLIKPRMKVFISSESVLPVGLEQFRISIPPEMMHDALYFASIFIGEGATMASEAGVLGTTSIYINPLKRAYCLDQERFGLVYNYCDFGSAIEKIKELIMNPENLIKNNPGRNLLLNEKIDLTAFLIWFVEKWPSSFADMKNDTDILSR